MRKNLFLSLSAAGLISVAPAKAEQVASVVNSPVVDTLYVSPTKTQDKQPIDAASDSVYRDIEPTLKARKLNDVYVPLSNLGDYIEGLSVSGDKTTVGLVYGGYYYIVSSSPNALTIGREVCPGQYLTMVDIGADGSVDKYDGVIPIDEDCERTRFPTDQELRDIYRESVRDIYDLYEIEVFGIRPRPTNYD